MKAGYASFNEADLSSDVVLEIRDDQFMPDRALAATQELVDNEGVDAMTLAVGTQQVVAVRDLLNSEFVPMLGA